MADKAAKTPAEPPAEKKPKKITHAYCHNKFHKTIPKIPRPGDLSVLYLHNNDITTIEHFNRMVNLESLYLQKNHVRRISGLDQLKKLQKLYLGHNEISVLEGLENLQSLQELNVEKQMLPDGNCLCFDPRSIFKISETLRILNIAGNRIQSIGILAPLRFLGVLNASKNQIQDLEEVCDVLKNWFYLKNANFSGNPIVKMRLYKESVIASVYRLDILDEKEISDTTRNFLKRLNEERVAKRLKPPVNLAQQIPGVPGNYPMSVQKAVSACILQDSVDSEIFDEKNAVFLPWKTLPKCEETPKLRFLAQKRRQSRRKRQKSAGHIKGFAGLKI